MIEGKKILEHIIKQQDVSILFFGMILLIMYLIWFTMYYRSNYLKCIESCESK